MRPFPRKEKGKGKGKEKEKGGREMSCRRQATHPGARGVSCSRGRGHRPGQRADSRNKVEDTLTLFLAPKRPSLQSIHLHSRNVDRACQSQGE